MTQNNILEHVAFENQEIINHSSTPVEISMSISPLQINQVEQYIDWLAIAVCNRLLIKHTDYQLVGILTEQPATTNMQALKYWLRAYLTNNEVLFLAQDNKLKFIEDKIKDLFENFWFGES